MRTKRRIPKPPKVTYRNRLREARLKAMIPYQRALAELAGMNPAMVSRYENNRQPLSMEHALVLAAVLKCGIGDLIEVVPNRKSALLAA